VDALDRLRIEGVNRPDQWRAGVSTGFRVLQLRVVRSVRAPAAGRESGRCPGSDERYSPSRMTAQRSCSSIEVFSWPWSLEATRSVIQMAGRRLWCQQAESGRTPGPSDVVL